ncbi:TFIIH subunit TTDA/Tfb5 [Ostreococcus tauri]|jgi:TFIIH basal transcription factor complex TTD-A subunit|uniref:General transcription and DNA repair factor IIH subunit TFB5 n=1 Tax=Ostreococcus tauri TaxID=70448 RepID=Q00V71_OSTTA|nr:TFIIH subunit TTDA/Tfb5 [Ostreococcus tauri]OUS49192.1 TFIIH subunit TTDA/Tfb5 [Ostreococcus tauri]CAL57556.1 TFIIH subunit TTDA/Tfb5 [Ostreococcus tauri]|eukprot:XP_003083281.1 TFIIH subunit TTDA/Tfb5 [Ostreococcus tauri]
MVSAVHGVMLTTDVPIKQYVLHLDAIAPAEGKFVIADLDERRVLIQPERAEQVKREIERYQQTTQYVAPNAMSKQ